MAVYLTKLFLYFLILLYLNIFNVRSDPSDCGDLDRYFLMRHQISGLVLDAYQVHTITIENYTNAETQQWRLTPSKTLGLFNIINKKTEKALDAIQGPTYVNASLNSLYDTDTQQWFINSEGTIINGGIVHHALDSYSRGVTYLLHSL